MKTRQINTIRTTLQRQYNERSKIEDKLLQEIRKYFDRLGRKVLTTYQKSTDEGIPTHNIQTLITILFSDWHKDYTSILVKYQKLAKKLSQKHIQELIKVQQKRTLGHRKTDDTLTIKPYLTLQDSPIRLLPTPLQSLAIKAQTTLDQILPKQKHYRIEENPVVKQKLEQQTFQFSEKTRARVTNEINQILTTSETEGIGNRQVGQLIQNKFGQLKKYEAERIARTEINRANNESNYETLLTEDLIDYYQWASTHDHRTRDSHQKIDGEIVRKGELFSNGLRFPGDPQGKAKEVINCRCTLVPWICPYDKMVPTGMTRFKESDLIPRPADDNKTKQIKKPKKTKQSSHEQPTRSVQSRQMSQQEMNTQFREENPEITRKMDDFGLREGEHYRYVQDNEGNIYIEWKSKDSSDIKDKVDDFLEKICPDDELYGYASQEDAIMAYTDEAHETINTITRMAKKYRNIIKDDEFKEKFINIHGIEKWNQFKRQLNQAYNYTYITKTSELMEHGHSVDTTENLYKAFINQNTKLPFNTRLYRGQDKWHGKIPEVGDEDTLGAFYSTSHDLSVCEEADFAGSGSESVIIEIDAPEDIDALLIGARGTNTKESEILFAPDQKIEYTEVFHDSDGRLHVHGKLIKENMDIDEFMDYISNYNIEW